MKKKKSLCSVFLVSIYSIYHVYIIYKMIYQAQSPSFFYLNIRVIHNLIFGLYVTQG